jgi:large subunit ribosomal protein L4
MNTKIYNITGKEAGTRELPEAVFGVVVKPELIQSVSRAQMANAFIPYAHTKDRSEVRGGGKKPWKQKGTGRARAGSSRSPLWSGGGVTFGPRNTKNPELKINKKEKQAAIRMVLTDKLASGRLIIVDSFEKATGKTAEIAKLLATVAESRPAIVATEKSNPVLTRAASNIPRTNTVLATSLNVRDLLKHRYLIVDNAGIDAIITQLSK